MLQSRDNEFVLALSKATSKPPKKDLHTISQWFLISQLTKYRNHMIWHFMESETTSQNFATDS